MLSGPRCLDLSAAHEARTILLVYSASCLQPDVGKALHLTESVIAEGLRCNKRFSELVKGHQSGSLLALLPHERVMGAWWFEHVHWQNVNGKLAEPAFWLVKNAQIMQSVVEPETP